MKNVPSSQGVCPNIHSDLTMHAILYSLDSKANNLINTIYISALVNDRSKVPDESFRASSYDGIKFRPGNARIDPIYHHGIYDHDGGAWCAVKEDKAPWISVDLGDIDIVESIDILGRKDANLYVTSFELLYSNHCMSWDLYTEGGKEKVNMLFKI